MITVVKPHWAWMKLSDTKMEWITQHLEECGRVCYRSEDRITPDSADKFVRKICRNNHVSVLEHEVLSARIICSRAASHQLVRHRIAAYSQSSQRYVNYGKKGMQVICPPSIGIPPGEYPLWKYSEQLSVGQNVWLDTVFKCYEEYLRELEQGVKPEDARFVLPNACKTEVVATYNIRMWRHVIKERGMNKHAQWEIRGIFNDIYENLKWRLPAIFEDLE